MKDMQYIRYDFDTNGLVIEVIDKLNEIIDAIVELQEEIKKLKEGEK